MFETAEIGHSIDKETYNREVPALRTALLAAQRELATSGMAVVVIIGGVEGAGKSEATPYKQYKLTEEDWRNRQKWEAYQAAACDMIEKTSSAHVPWVLVEADNKEWARIKVLKTVVERLEEELGE